MEHLRDADVAALLDAVQRTTAARDPDEFARVALESCARLVPCDVATYNEVEPGRCISLWEPEDAKPEDVDESLLRHQDEHPLIRVARTGDGSPRAISDFLSPDEFRRLRLYELIFGPLGLEDQMAVSLPAPLPLAIGIALNRATRGFSERERVTLNLLRPHLAQAHRTVHTLESLRTTIAKLEAGLEADGTSVVQIGRNDTFEEVTPGAAGWMHEVLGARDDRLPEPVARWVEAERDRLSSGDRLPPLSRPFVVESEGERISIRLVPGTEGDLLVGRTRPQRPRREVLSWIGLTERQAEVVDLLVEGSTNEHIAESLGISVSAVKRHLEDSYRKLGVENRVAAASYVVDLMSFAD